MEKIASELKVTELKQSTICKAMEDLHAQASSVLLITLQWKDLQQHFDSTRNELQSLLQQVAEREKQTSLREKEREAQWMQICSQLELKQRRLSEVDSLIEKKTEETKSYEKHIESLVTLIQENCEELEHKEKQFGALNVRLSEREREFDQLNKSVAERKFRLESLQTIVREAESRAKELESKGKEVEKLRALMRKYNDEIELKERKFNALRRSVDEKREEVVAKEEEVRYYTNVIGEFEKDIKLKQEKLNSILSSIEKCSTELESKQKLHDSVREEIESKEKRFASLTKSMEECHSRLDAREAEFKGLFVKLGVKERALELKFAEVDQLYKKVNECVKEVELKGEAVELKEKDIDKRCKELRVKEKQFEARLKQFQLEKKDFDEKARMVKVKIEQPENGCASGASLLLLWNQHLKRHDLLIDEIYASLNVASDPARLVLDAIKDFYPSNKNDDFDLRTIRRSCILLLEQLMKTSSQINDKVKKEALELAINWKCKLSVETGDNLEVLGFLELLAAFKLSCSFNVDDLWSLLQIVSHHRQAPVLRHVLGIADNDPVKDDQVKYSPGSPAPNFHPSTGGIDLHCENDHSSKNDLETKETLEALQMSQDPATFVLDKMGGVFRKYWNVPNQVCNASVMKDLTSMLNQLMRFSAQIRPSVREDALKLALEWKDKLRVVTENSFEILCFLQFMATYQLVSSFDKDVIIKSLDKISQHKEALELCTTLGFAEHIPELARTLVAKNQHLDAVRLICLYKLANKISPSELLNDYLDLIKNSARNICKRKRPTEFKRKARNEEVAALKSVKQCVIKYNLESSFPLVNIDKRIDLLEKIIKDGRCWTPSDASQPNVAEKRKKHITRTFEHNEQQQNRNKRPWIATPIWSTVPRGSGIYTPAFPQASPSANAQRKAMAANSTWQYDGFGANLEAGQNARLPHSYDTLSIRY